jgi:hypothetical protein
MAREVRLGLLRRPAGRVVGWELAGGDPISSGDPRRGSGPLIADADGGRRTRVLGGGWVVRMWRQGFVSFLGALSFACPVRFCRVGFGLVVGLGGLELCVRSGYLVWALSRVSI